MAKRRQLVLIKLENPADPLGPLAPLGTPAAFRAVVARFNTAPDGGTSPAQGTERLHGPGMTIDIAAAQPQVRQALVNCTDEDIAWPVLRGICKAAGWKLQDIESGQMFG